MDVVATDCCSQNNYRTHFVTFFEERINKSVHFLEQKKKDPDLISLN